MIADTQPARLGDKAAFDLANFASSATVLVDGRSQSLSLSDGYRRIRIDIRKGSLFNEAISLKFIIDDDDRLSTQLLGLTRFRAYRRTYAFGNWLDRPDHVARRLILQLRSFDAVQSGASERAIAQALFPDRYKNEGWRDGSESLRSYVRRLIVTSRRLARRDYQRLLT